MGHDGDAMQGHHHSYESTQLNEHFSKLMMFPHLPSYLLAEYKMELNLHFKDHKIQLMTLLHFQVH